MQTFEDDRPVWQHLKLIQLPSDSSGLAQATAMIEEFKKDPIIFEFIQKNIVALVSDGAPSMIGKNNGMAFHVRKMLHRPDLIVHHCLAHRLELAFGHPMRKYVVFEKLETGGNKLYAFFHMSHKRTALFDEYMISKQKQTFRATKLFKVRWVDTHCKVMKKITNRWSDLIEGLDYVIEQESQLNTASAKNTVEKANDLQDFLKDRNALAIMHFNIDIQERFATESLAFQTRLSSLIGQDDR